MEFTTYSHRDPRLIAVDIYLTMVNSATLMGLKLTEPVYEIKPVDPTGGRYIRVRAGVLDALNIDTNHDTD
jgi:hypothetical protein